MLEDFNDDINKILNKIDLESLLSKLPAKERDILNWWFIEGYTRDEIAKMLQKKYNENKDTDRKTVKTMILTVINKLKSVVEGEQSV